MLHPLPPAFLPPATFLPLSAPRRRRLRAPLSCADPPSPSAPPTASPSAPAPPHAQVLLTESTPSRPQASRGYTLDPATQCLSPARVRPPPAARAAPRTPLALARDQLLPAGWPATVAPGYARWAVCHVCRHVFRSAYYVLGTTSLLRALGVGAGDALAVGAALQWVLKDGLGLVAKLALSTQLARVVDRDAKRWRVAGDALMAASAAVEIAAVTRPAYFLAFGAAAALLRDAASAMSGPSYRVFLDAFAVNANIGDVSSRGEAQVVLGNLLGLGLGSAISTFLASLPAAEQLLPTLAFYAVLASAHMASTYNAVSTVQLHTLNWQRLNLVVDDFLETGNVPPVAEVNQRERIVYVRAPPPSRRQLRIGAPLLDFVTCAQQVSHAIYDRNDRFIIAYEDGCVGVILRDDATPDDVLRGYLLGRRLLQRLDAFANTPTADQRLFNCLYMENYEWVDQAYPDFLEGLEIRGWTTSKLLIPVEESRYNQNVSS